ncbi:maturation protein [ssRNA phage SRR6960509_17]|uniref:Maturation protein n=1 Tax=ssRNA phage SRR6960509_17 TaxID=2786528 RepID=A0A8S5L4E0_9VIRU|nr:maturation protein [ssRNA phage SRR6960509_17]DAD52574.1 TPA_asm: maturation protein [ssRNA phage SRR6960509_17]
MTVKRRNYIIDAGTSQYSIVDDLGHVVYKAEGSTVFYGLQETTSESHRWPPSRRDRDLDVGGDFSSRKTSGHTPGTYIRVQSAPPGTPGTTIRYWEGHFYPYYSESPYWIGTLFPTAAPSLGEMIVDGSTAIARANPVRQRASLAVGVAELARDGIPFRGLVGSRISGWRDAAGRLLDLFNRARSSPARVASELYLEYQFGFRPLVHDIQDFIRQATSLNETVRQLHRDNDRVVRRRYRFPSQATRTTVMSGVPSYGAPVLDTYLYAAPGRLEWIWEHREERSFSGAFRYHIPFNLTGTFAEHRAQGRALARIIFGVDLNIQTVYQAAPWSWALDWVSNTGDVIANIVSHQEDGLVMKYGYQSQHNIDDNIFTLSDIEFTYPPGKHTFMQSLAGETKNRIRATPYGFGLNVDHFTDRQWALIAALGISRTPRSLNL